MGGAVSTAGTAVARRTIFGTGTAKQHFIPDSAQGAYSAIPQTPSYKGKGLKEGEGATREGEEGRGREKRGAREEERRYTTFAVHR